MFKNVNNILTFVPNTQKNHHKKSIQKKHTDKQKKQTNYNIQKTKTDRQNYNFSQCTTSKLL